MPKKKFDITKLRINENNPFPFEGSEDQWEKFMEKLDQNHVFCQANKIAYDSTDNFLVIAGNKRTKAFLELGWKEIPSDYVFDCKEWTEEQRHEYIVASNANWGTWDASILETHFDDIVFDYDLSFGDEAIADVDYSAKNKEIDVDDLGDDMKLVLNFDSTAYWEVKKRLSEIAQTPEGAIIKLLNIEDES